MERLVRRLQNPHYVSSVQKFFGLIPAKPDENLNTPIANGNIHYKKEQTSFHKNGLRKQAREETCTDLYNDRAPKEIAYLAKHKSLHYLFKLASLLGHEPFYLLFYPLFGWNADFYITRVTALLWGVVMYLGQATKDVLCWPRPRYPPVLNLETQYMLEHGMPSTHAMAGTAMPFTLMYFISSRYDVSWWLLLCIAVPWSGLVCLSRLYLGVHFVGDIIIGVAYSVAIMVVMLPYLDAIDYFMQTSYMSPIIFFVIAILLCTKLYPVREATTAKVDSSNIVAVVYGLMLGVWVNYNLGIIKMADSNLRPYQVLYPTWSWIALSMVRMIVGVIVVGVSKVILKGVLIPTISIVSQREKSSGLVLGIYRFITYTVLGFLISHVIPRLFYLLNVDRKGFYTEGS